MPFTHTNNRKTGPEKITLVVDQNKATLSLAGSAHTLRNLGAVRP